MGGWETILPPSAPPSHPTHFEPAPSLGHSTAEDLPQRPLPSRPRASVYLEELLPGEPLVPLLKLFICPGVLPKGGDRERETRSLRWGVWGQTPVPGAPRRSASPHGTFHHGPGPWRLMACGRGSMFPPRASVPSPPRGRSALGQRPPAAEHVLMKPSWLQPHLTLQETDSCRRIPGLTHRGPQEPAIPVPALCHLPGNLS